jgi:hypothetical protein
VAQRQRGGSPGTSRYGNKRGMERIMPGFLTAKPKPPKRGNGGLFKKGKGKK